MHPAALTECRARGRIFIGNSSLRRGRATHEESHREVRDFFPRLGRPSRGRASLLDIVLPGFCPAVYPFFKDCLSRTSRPPQHAGTLDAHLTNSCPTILPTSSRLLPAPGFTGKTVGLDVV